MSFVENAYDEVFAEELRVRRNPKFEEHRVHAILYLIEPTGLALRPVDAEFMYKLSERGNVIPIISKADSFTAVERQKFKLQVIFLFKDFPPLILWNSLLMTLWK